jgi:transposase-like protein
MSIPNLSPDAAAWLDEVAKDYGIVYANLIAMRQATLRLQDDLAAALKARDAAQERMNALIDDNKTLADQLRGRELPTPQSRRKKG